MRNAARLVTVALLAACNRAAVPPPAMPLDHAPAPRPLRERVALFEWATCVLDVEGVRYELVEQRCRDLVPRGGSDCHELMRSTHRVSLRAVDLASGQRRWDRPLSDAAREAVALRVEGDALVLTTARGVERFARLDGAPQR